MMTEADFAALAEHLERVTPVFDRFCANHGFAYVPKKSLGRYPRIRIEREGEVRIWFDLWMQLGKDGHRLEKYIPDAPYELSAGAYVDVPDGTKYGIRYQKALQCFSGKPFSAVPATLEAEMEKHLLELRKWDSDYLKNSGQAVRLGK